MLPPGEKPPAPASVEPVIHRRCTRAGLARARRATGIAACQCCSGAFGRRPLERVRVSGLAAPPTTAGALQAVLGAQYAVERELGRGGTATVYLARDMRHRRPVAVKVLHPDRAAALGPARFLREIELTASLQHPQILPLFDSGAAGGLLYYVMPYVDGETLRARLAREGRPPVRDALRLVRELADALAHAHRHGVVHRDLKPENVLLSGGHAVVSDFGIAKAVAAAADAGRITGQTTGLGVAVGTPAYMAPEQATGEATIDHRADLYALGILAYEVLVGAHPFAGRAAAAMFTAHLTEVPACLVDKRPEVPRPVGTLVVRLLAKDPDERPQTASDVVAALDAVTTSVRGIAVVPALRRSHRRFLAATALLLTIAGVVPVAVSIVRPRGVAQRPALVSRPRDYMGRLGDAHATRRFAHGIRGGLTRLTGMQVIDTTRSRP